MTILPEKLIAARSAKGWSQDDLAERAGVSQQTIGKLEKGTARTSKFLMKIASALAIPPGEIDDEYDGIEAKAGTGSLGPGNYKPPPQLLGERNLKVFASVEGGPGEMMVFSTDPLEIVQRPWYVERDPEAFGVFLAGDSMEPVYEAGEIVVVSPRAPLVKGKEAVFVAEPAGGDFRASLKRYRGQTEKDWLAKQFNPEKDLKFDRGLWRKAYRVLGSFDG